jgi:aryl-alcohol dehydrogenase-like predicted oxidoreductase
MKTKVLGNSDLHITPIGFGAWAVGGDWQFGWGHQDDGDSIGAILTALENGVNWIDTAAVYGLGRSEEVVAEALRQWSGPRPYVFTKCGMVWDESRKVDYSLKAASVRRECENSLRRLGVEVIDLYQVHWPSDDLAETEEGWRELVKLRDEGKIRWMGASNFNLDELQAVQRIAPVTSLQPPFSLIRREAQIELLPYCLTQNIGVICYSPMGSGLLTGAMTRDRIAGLPHSDWRTRSPEFQEPKLSRNLAIAQALRAIGQHHGVSAGEAAIAWVLNHPAVTGAIVGARNSKQVEGILGAANLHLAPAEIDLVESV